VLACIAGAKLAAWFGAARRGSSARDGIYGPAIDSAEMQMEGLVRGRCRNARVSHIGVPYIDPRHLLFLIRTDTDLERDELRSDPTLTEMLRGTLIPSGYPSDAATLVEFDFQSEETVRRDFRGSWYYAMK
jgi:hypothetical protein